MAGSDIAAAIMGALGGGLHGYGQVQQRKQQQLEAEERARQQQFENELRVRTLERQQASDDRAAKRELRTDYEQILGTAGAGSALSSADVSGLEEVGLGSRIDRGGTRYDDVLGQQDLGLPAPLPSMTGQPVIAETAKDRQARETAQASRQQAGQQDMQAQGAIRTAPLHLRDWMKSQYQGTGKVPTVSADDYEDPAAAAERKWGEEKRGLDYRNSQDVGRIRLSDTLARARDVAKPTAAGGGGRGLPAGNAERLADTTGGLSELDAIEAELQATNGSTGMGAAAGAWLPNAVTEMTGVGGAAKERQAVIDRVKQIVGKAMEGGVLRKEDEVKYARILPTIGDAPAVAQSKIQGLRRALQQQYQRDLESFTDAGYDVSGYQRRQGGAPSPSVTSAPRPGGQSLSVTTPDGQTFQFPNAEAADAFRQKAGLR